MNHTNEIIGYHVVNTRAQFFVDSSGDGYNFEVYTEPTPIARGDAFRRLAAFLDTHPGEDHDHYTVEAVYRKFTPVEKATSDLTDRLVSLLRSNGVSATRDAVEKKIAEELAEIGATSIEEAFAQLR